MCGPTWILKWGPWEAFSLNFETCDKANFGNEQWHVGKTEKGHKISNYRTGRPWIISNSCSHSFKSSCEFTKTDTTPGTQLKTCSLRIGKNLFRVNQRELPMVWYNSISWLIQLGRVFILVSEKQPFLLNILKPRGPVPPWNLSCATRWTAATLHVNSCLRNRLTVLDPLLNACGQESRTQPNPTHHTF